MIVFPSKYLDLFYVTRIVTINIGVHHVQLPLEDLNE